MFGNISSLSARFLVAVCWTITCGAHAALADQPARVRIRGAATDLGETPILVEVKKDLPEGNYRLTTSDGDQSSRANLFRVDGKLWAAIVVDRLKATEDRVFTLDPVVSKELSESGVRLTDGDSANVKVAIGGKPFTEYRLDQGPKPIYFPLIGPGGQGMTRAFPIENVEGEDRDHFHQRSFWFTHGNVNGVDFWASDPLNGSKANFGTIKEVSRPARIDGLAMGALATTDDWLASDGRKICRDRRDVRFWNLRNTRIIDFDIKIFADADPVTFGDTKEGMFGLRVASSMDVKRKMGGKITNADGVTDGDAWGKASPWVDYTGPVGGKTVGVAILNHPDSFRYPTTWHVRDYGLFAANPFGWRDFGRKESGDFTIPLKGSVAFRYRVVLHGGATAAANIPAQFQAYVKPPRVEWIDE
jgi:Methane oxygenase PmoA